MSSELLLFYIFLHNCFELCFQTNIKTKSERNKYSSFVGSSFLFGATCKYIDVVTNTLF
jgi:hypothetical protein